MKIPYLRTKSDNNESLTLIIGGVPTPIDSSHPAFDEINANLDTITPQEVRELLDTSRRVKRALAHYGNVTIDEGQVLYKGEVVHGMLADRMMSMLEDGYDIRPWALFLENLQQNPAKHAVDELYGWLEHANMPITERGNFLAYKKVKEDYTSYHRNSDNTQFHNDIGTMVTMPRNKVDDNRNRTCSSGLHFCSWDYLSSYMGTTGKVIILEINPAHVVSIPTDYNNAKGRAEGYLIVGEIPQEECEHAFPGLSYVGYDDSEYILWEQDEPIDYSEIEDGWLSDIDECDLDTLEDDVEIAYNKGYNHGYTDGNKSSWNMPQMTEKDFTFEDEFIGYQDGYNDGYYNGYTDYQYTNQDPVKDMKPKSSPENWTINSVVDDINNKRLTVFELIKEYDVDSYTVDLIIEEID